MWWLATRKMTYKNHKYKEKYILMKHGKELYVWGNTMKVQI